MKHQLRLRVFAGILILLFSSSILSSCAVRGWVDSHKMHWTRGVKKASISNQVNIASQIQVIYLRNGGPDISADVTLTVDNNAQPPIHLTTVNGVYSSPPIGVGTPQTLKVVVTDNTSGISSGPIDVMADDWGEKFNPNFGVVWNPQASCIVIMDQSVGVEGNGQK